MTRTYGPDEPKSLLFQLANGAWQQRASAAWQLGMHDTDEVVEGLVAALKRDEDTAVLMEVVASLDRIRAPLALPALRRVANELASGTLHEELVAKAARVAVARLEAHEP